MSITLSKKNLRKILLIFFISFIIFLGFHAFLKQKASAMFIPGGNGGDPYCKLTTSSALTPVNLVFLIDDSNSMQQKGSNNVDHTKIFEAMKALKGFVKDAKTDDNIKRIGVVLFSTNDHTNSDITGGGMLQPSAYVGDGSGTKNGDLIIQRIEKRKEPNPYFPIYIPGSCDDHQDTCPDLGYFKKPQKYHYSTCSDSYGTPSVNPYGNSATYNDQYWKSCDTYRTHDRTQLLQGENLASDMLWNYANNDWKRFNSENTAIILLSDGKPTDPRQDDINKFRKMANTFHLWVFSVGYGVPGGGSDQQIKEDFLRNVAGVGEFGDSANFDAGGNYIYAADGEDLQSIYKSILTRIENYGLVCDDPQLKLTCSEPTNTSINWNITCKQKNNYNNGCSKLSFVVNDSNNTGQCNTPVTKSGSNINILCPNTNGVPGMKYTGQVNDQYFVSQDTNSCTLPSAPNLHLTCTPNPGNKSVTWNMSCTGDNCGNVDYQLKVTGGSNYNSGLVDEGSKSSDNLPSSSGQDGDYNGVLTDGNSQALPAYNPAPCHLGVITSASQYFTVNGSDAREDAGFSNNVPSNNLHIMYPGNGGTNGILFAGKVVPANPPNPALPFFGQLQSNWNGISSVNHWIVGGTSYQDIFPLNNLTTSYAYYNELLLHNPNITVTANNNCSASADCVNDILSSNSNNPGVYLIRGDVTVKNSPSFKPNVSYLFLINGRLTINAPVIVPPKTSVIFAVGKDSADRQNDYSYNTGNTLSSSEFGNTIVCSTVGESTPLDPISNPSQWSNICAPPDLSSFPPNLNYCDLEGTYISDNKFRIQGNLNGSLITIPSQTLMGTCAADTTTDKQLNIGGSVIVNAAGTASNTQLDNNRPIQSVSNPYSPSFTVRERPDMYLALPEFLKQQNTVWQEIAP